jgi:hypothetical protein
MGKEKRIIDTSSGQIGEELINFPENYHQPAQKDKKKIQAGYLDLLYYEYRMMVASRDDMICVLLILIPTLILISQPYVIATCTIIVVCGIWGMVRNRGTQRKFRQYRELLAAELLPLGVAVEDKQLSDHTIGSTAWGKLNQYAVSSLGIVRPVSTKGFPEDMLYVFNLGSLAELVGVFPFTERVFGLN